MINMHSVSFQTAMMKEAAKKIDYDEKYKRHNSKKLLLEFDTDDAMGVPVKFKKREQLIEKSTNSIIDKRKSENYETEID